MITVGLTGGIGSGKTTVAKIWEQMGAYVVNADSLAKELMTTDPDLRMSITAAFGDESYYPDGSLNRKFLSEQAFDSGRVEELNNLVHPAVYRKTAEMIDSAKTAGHQVFVKEAALLLKNGRPDNMDVIVLVTSQLQDRIDRVVMRDSFSEKEVRNRIKLQQDDAEMIPQADILIKNDQDIAHLKAESERIFRILENYNPEDGKKSDIGRQ